MISNEPGPRAFIGHPVEAYGVGDGDVHPDHSKCFPSEGLKVSGFGSIHGNGYAGADPDVRVKIMRGNPLLRSSSGKTKRGSLRACWWALLLTYLERSLTGTPGGSVPRWRTP